MHDKSIAHRLLDMLETSVIGQLLLAIVILGPIAYLSCVARPIPDVLGQLALIIVGFFFGSKSVAQVYSARREAMEDVERINKGRVE